MTNVYRRCHAGLSGAASNGNTYSEDAKRSLTIRTVCHPERSRGVSQARFLHFGRNDKAGPGAAADSDPALRQA